ncbi:MAG: hypothetical protein NTY09_00360 [bacterium]|nr:hypothetical protein [bacterium]
MNTYLSEIAADNLKQAESLKALAASRLLKAKKIYENLNWDDARLKALVSLLSDAHVLILHFIFEQEKLIDFSKWPTQYSHYPPGDKAIIRKNYDNFIKFLFIVRLFSRFESLVRSLLPQFDKSYFDKNCRSTMKLSIRLLNIAQCASNDHLSLIEILSLLRNMIHWNETFCPPDGQDKTILYKGIQYDFKVIKSPDWVYWQLVLQMASHLVDLVWEVVSSEEIKKYNDAIIGPQLEGEGLCQ